MSDNSIRTATLMNRNYGQKNERKKYVFIALRLINRLCTARIQRNEISDGEKVFEWQNFFDVITCTLHSIRVARKEQISQIFPPLEQFFAQFSLHRSKVKSYYPKSEEESVDCICIRTKVTHNTSFYIADQSKTWREKIEIKTSHTTH